MVRYIPSPDARALLLPLLACLPTAFASRRPPPALLPLLSPILRQRVQLLAGDSGPESWVSLLSWDPQRASKLPEVVQQLELEPHPVSGEIELEEVDEVEYRRLDEETLHARLGLPGHNLLAVYLWCVGDEGGGGDGWRLSELRSLEDKDDAMQWYGSMSEADDGAKEQYVRDALRQDSAHASTSNLAATNSSTNANNNQEDDDDDYWASYDRTPGRTPMKRSPVPAQTSASRVQIGPTESELEYFARYATEVQPAMDPHDPDEEGVAPGESTLHGQTITRELREPQTEPESQNLGPSGFDPPLPLAAETTNGIINGTASANEARELHHPRPSSSHSSASSVEKLEKIAEEEHTHIPTQAEVGIKQHISTDIKSLYRLAKAAGIDRAEFERIVKTELDCLGMMDQMMEA